MGHANPVSGPTSKQGPEVARKAASTTARNDAGSTKQGKPCYKTLMKPICVKPRHATCTGRNCPDWQEASDGRGSGPPASVNGSGGTSGIRAGAASLPPVTGDLFDGILPPAGYEDIGSALWLLSRSGKYDRRGCELVRGHYSRRKPNSPQFMPPGETVVLVARDRMALWGWWRPHPRSGIRAMNGLDGWTCTVFARHGGALASVLVLDAERALGLLDASGRLAGPCGPSGLITYVDRRKVPGTNPGYCFKVAGWRKTGTSAKGEKDLLQKPFEMAGRRL
jgi:hypothetical protein